MIVRHHEHRAIKFYCGVVAAAGLGVAVLAIPAVVALVAVVAVMALFMAIGWHH